MPSTATATHPSGLCIHFEEDNHAYVDENGMRYTSVSAIVKACFPVFEADTIAALVAAREGKTTEAVLAEWAGKRDRAAAFGTRVHAVAEEIAIGDPTCAVPADDRERAAFAAAYDSLHGMMAAGMVVVGTELIVFSPRLAIAGTIDLVMRDGDTLFVLDWKTNERIDMASEYGKAGLGRLRHRPDCNFERYTLQVNLYRRLLMEEGYLSPAIRDVRLGLLHLPPMAAQAVPIPVEVRELDAAEAVIRHLTNVPF
jgi:hypothetical protein